MAQVDEFPTNIASPERGASTEQLVAYVANLANIVARMAKSLEFVINGNIGDVNIKANSITALKMDVQELSAITANLGKITAGEIYGTKIATSETGYPRAEMSNTGKYFRAAATANNEAVLTSLGSVASAPSLIFNDGFTNVRHQIFGGIGFQVVTGFHSTASYDIISPNVRVVASIGDLELNGRIYINDSFYYLGQAIVPSSSATDVAGLRTDFNNLLATLRVLKIIAP